MKKALNRNNIYFHSDSFDFVVNNPEKYDYSVLMDVSFLSIWHRKRLLDYTFKKVIISSFNDILLFKEDLKSLNLYDYYVESIINSDDVFLKSSLIIYLDDSLKDSLFIDNLELTNAIINSNEDYVLKLSNLLNVSQFKCDKDTYDYLKENFKNILYSNNDDEEENKELLNKYFNLMDKNQIELGNEVVLKNIKD